ncbi:helix-turn-helix domain-containing protein [Candidatus Shapirobacteria bacterium]|nr:helix-turn-helix domain-containing protein [Candidatus Shapirobacteria bacterium]
MTSSNLPTVTWETSIEHEALRIIYYLMRLPERELQNRGFLVLPSSNPQNSNRTIVVPDLPYHLVSRIWFLVSKLIPTTPMTAPSSLTDQIVELLKPTYHPPNLQIFQTDFGTIKESFFKSLFFLLPNSKNRLQKINIIVTHSGTCSQFNMLTPTKTTLTVYLRSDSKITDLIQVIVLSLIRHDLQHIEHRSWEEIQTVADFLLTHTSLNESIKPFNHLTMMPRLQQKQSGKLIKASQNYQSKLGIPTQNNWRISSNEIFYQSIKIDQLTPRQSKLLKLLIKKYGEVVSNDQIADALWPNGENYSLWAIVKEIARIRACIVSSGLPGSLLQSHRKLGYSLR